MTKSKIIGYEKVKDEDAVKNVISLFNEANCKERQDWEYWSHKSSNFYYDKQLDGETIRQLVAAQRPTFTINRITPGIDVMKFFLTANNPRWKSIGRDTSGYDTNMAIIHDALIDYCFNKVSDGRSVYSQVIHDAIVNQCGNFFVYVDKNLDHGMGEVVVDFIDYRHVFWDKRSKDKYGRDAGYVIIAYNDTKSSLKQKLPEYADKINKAEGNYIGITELSWWGDTVDEIPLSGTNPITGQTEETIGYYECYRKIKVPYISFERFLPPSREQLENIKSISEKKLTLIAKEIEVKLKETEISLSKSVKNDEIIQDRAELEMEKARGNAMGYLEQARAEIEREARKNILNTSEEHITEEEYLELIKEADFEDLIIPNSYNKYYETRFVVECVVGNKLLYSIILNRSEYPIVKIPYIHTGNPWPLGAIKYVIGKQEELNRAHQIMIHHANLSSNPITYAKQGTFVSGLDDARRRKAIAGSIIEIASNEDKPEDRPPAPLSNAFYTIQEESKSDIDFGLGIDPRLFGAGNIKDEPYRTTALLDKVATRKIQAWLNQTVEPGLELMGKVFTEIAQDTYTAHKVWRIVSPMANNENIGATEFEINKTVYDKNGQISKMFDYQSVQFDVKIVAGSVWPTSKERDEERLHVLWREGAIDLAAFLPAIEGIPDKEGILHRLDERNILRQQNEQLTEQLKSIQGDNQTLRRQVIQSGIRVDQIEGSLQMRKDILETEASETKYKSELKSSIDTAINKVTLMVDNLKKEMDLIKKEKKNEKTLDKEKKS